MTTLLEKFNDFDFEGGDTFTYIKDYDLTTEDGKAEYKADSDLIKDWDRPNRLGMYFSVRYLKSSVFSTEHVELDLRLWKKNQYGV